jgi:uncharacterized glyoxalase superfamily protein PhnB
MPVKPVPDTFHTVTPYLVVSDAKALLDFVTQAFGAVTAHVMKGPDGSVGHADVVIGDSHVMMGQARQGYPAIPSMLYLYLPDCDATYEKALAAGATSIEAPKTQFYGDRQGAVRDANGNQWYLATRVEDVSEEEMARRMKQARG